MFLSPRKPKICQYKYQYASISIVKWRATHMQINTHLTPQLSDLEKWVFEKT